MNNADMPAMPIEINGFGQYAPAAYTGLTKREQFAAMAMQGMLSSMYASDFGSEINDKSYDMPHGLANNAVRYADALLQELEK